MSFPCANNCYLVVLADHPLRFDVNLQMPFPSLDTFLCYSLREFGHKSRYFFFQNVFLSHNLYSVANVVVIVIFWSIFNGIRETNNARETFQKLNVNFAAVYGYFVILQFAIWVLFRNFAYWSLVVRILSTQWVPREASHSFVDSIGFF